MAHVCVLEGASVAGGIICSASRARWTAIDADVLRTACMRDRFRSE